MKSDLMNRRDFLRSAALAAAGISLAACAPSAPGAAEPTVAPVTASEPEKVTLSMWTHDNLYVQFFTARAEEWKANYPQYEFTFDFQQVPDVFTKMLSSLSASEPVPDLFGLEQGQFGKYTKDDLIAAKFVDLTDLIGAERDKFVENTWAKYTFQGKIYGVESALCTCGYYFQPAVLEKAGLDKLPETWEDFMDAGIQAAGEGIYLSAIDAEGTAIFDMLFMQRGGQYFDQDANFVLGESPNREIALEVLDYLKKGIDEKVFWPASSGDFWGAGLMAAHKEGKVMGLPEADWWSDYILKPNAADQSGNWNIGLFPKWKSGGHGSSVSGGTGFTITKDSAHPDLAWDLLHYAYMTKENQLKRFSEIKYLPSMYDALNDSSFTSYTDAYYVDQPIGSIWSQAAQDMPLYYQSPVRGDMMTELTTQVTNFYAGKINADAALDGVISVTEKAIMDL